MDIVLYLSEPFQLAHHTMVVASGCFDNVAMHMVLLCTNGCHSQYDLSQPVVLFLSFPLL